MMNQLSYSICTAAVLAMLAACQQKDESAVTSDASRSQTTPTAASQTSTQDPSLPKASAALAADDASDKAETQGTAALQHTPTPRKEMTKKDESKSMPMPGQANDHSTTVFDKNKGM